MFANKTNPLGISGEFWRRYSPLLIAIMIGIFLLGVTGYVGFVEQQVRIKEERTYVATVAAGMRARLEGELNSSVHLGLGLATYVVANPKFNADNFNLLVATLVHYGRHLRTITMAPDNVVRYVYPLAGNENLLGLRYQDQELGSVSDMQQSRHPELVGPIDLVQGGRGLVHRLPVFVPNPAGGESYWGAASVVLDLDSLLKAAGFRADDSSITYALRRFDSQGNTEMIVGKQDVFDRSPILLDISLGEHTNWQLACMPTAGWGQLSQPVNWVLMIGGILALILSTLAYVWLRSIQQLRQRDAESRLARSVFNSSNEGMLITSPRDDVIGMNPAVTAITGYTAAELLGMPLSFLTAENITPEDQRKVHAAVSQHGVWQGEIHARHKGGHVFPVALTVTAVLDKIGKPSSFINTFSDISERKSNEARIQDLALRDTLTGLPNRMDLYNRLEALLEQGQSLAVMILDLDNFKIINDTLGHAVGDQLLVEVGKRLMTAINPRDIVSRLGGDEFVVVLVNEHASQVAGSLAESILLKLARPYLIEGYELHSSSSIGIGIYPADGNDASSLLKNVDTAMYEAKSHGKNNYKFFTEKMREQISERLRLENHLRQALFRQEFELHYQPQVHIASGQITGVEALIRWNHPQWGMVQPDKFIRIAEDSNLIVPLGEWVLQEACRQISKWRGEGLDELCMSVNISARQLQSRHLFSLIDHLVATHDIKPGTLELEITESVAMDDPEQTISRMKKLRAKGVALAIDDFGTGYSSLSYLKLLPLTRLKIDRSFVKDIETDPNDAAICTATIALAQILDLGLVAEGVETEAQLNYLREQGCDTAQGYYFSKPLPAQQLFDFIQRFQQGQVTTP